MAENVHRKWDFKEDDSLLGQILEDSVKRRIIMILFRLEDYIGRMSDDKVDILNLMWSAVQESTIQVNEFNTIITRLNETKRREFLSDLEFLGLMNVEEVDVTLSNQQNKNFYTFYGPGLVQVDENGRKKVQLSKVALKSLFNKKYTEKIGFPTLNKSLEGLKGLLCNGRVFHTIVFENESPFKPGYDRYATVMLSDDFFEMLSKIKDFAVKSNMYDTFEEQLSLSEILLRDIKRQLEEYNRYFAKIHISRMISKAFKPHLKNLGALSIERSDHEILTAFEKIKGVANQFEEKLGLLNYLYEHDMNVRQYFEGNPPGFDVTDNFRIERLLNSWFLVESTMTWLTTIKEKFRRMKMTEGGFLAALLNFPFPHEDLTNLIDSLLKEVKKTVYMRRVS